MKNLLFTLLLILPFQGFSQIEKAVKPVASPLPALPAEARSASAGKTRAVVIGISDYQDPQIPDLRFADRDAEAFANFLRSPAGGSLDGDHLKALLNSEATVAQFDAALGWLLDESKPGDQAIIYFSGHGDVETKTRNQHGFLLCWDSPPQSYISGAYPIFFLKDVVTTLSTENKARVLIITDACRSGKLAGNSIGGAQLTSQNLAQQFANEIKILSCQPDEYSLEGEQWGGGRGAFSFHLVDGLYGLADVNSDGSVNLMEISRHLEDHVTPEVSPQSQVPMTVGSRTEKLAAVFPDILAQVKKNKAGQLPIFSATDSKGIEDEVLATVDSTIRALYYRFKKALKEKVFLEPPGECADAYYLRLIAEPKLERLHNSMRRNYAAALQDDAQQAINDLMAMEKTDVNLYRLERLKKYAPYPRLLERASELLGNQHYMYPVLQARKYYFEGKVLQLESPINVDSALGHRLLNIYHKSLQWQPNAAATYLAMSTVYDNIIPNADSMLFYTKRTIDIAPSWTRAYTSTARRLIYKFRKYQDAKELIDQAIQVDSTSPYPWITLSILESEANGNFSGAEQYLLKAIALDSTQSTAYDALGYLYFIQNKTVKAKQAFLKAIETSKPLPSILTFLGALHSNAGQFAEAEPYYKMALEIEPRDVNCLRSLALVYFKTGRVEEGHHLIKQAMGYDSSAWALLMVGETYMDAGWYDKAIDLMKRATVLKPNDFFGWGFLGQCYSRSGRYEEAIRTLLHTLSLAPHDLYTQNDLAEAYRLSGDLDAAREAYLKIIDMNPESPFGYMGMIKVVLAGGKHDEAMIYLEKAVQRGVSFEEVNIPEFKGLSGFAELMKKHFPEQVKD